MGALRQALAGAARAASCSTLYPRLDFPVLLLWADARPAAIRSQAAEEALDLLPDAPAARAAAAPASCMAYDDPVGVARELAAFCG